jgi:hypothetical protein
MAAAGANVAAVNASAAVHNWPSIHFAIDFMNLSLPPAGSCFVRSMSLLYKGLA